MAITSELRRPPAALALVCALLFLAGSFALAPGQSGATGTVPDAVPPSEVAMDAPRGPAPQPAAGPEPLQETSGRALYGTFWEENLGQWADPALWVLRGGATVALTPDGLLVPTADGVVRFEFVGGEGTSVQVVEALGSTTSVFGSESIVGARHAERLRMEAVWPGIDFDVYIASSGSLEYDFRVHPGADPAMARMEVTGVVPVLEDGRLVLGGFSFQAPRSFQGDASVASHFVLDGQTVGVEVGPYDPAQMLVIDPMLDYGTVLAPQMGSMDHKVYAAKETDDGMYFAGTLEEPYSASWHPLLTQVFDATGYGEYVGFFVHLHPDTRELLHFVQLRVEEPSCASTGWCWGGTFAYDLDTDPQGRVYLVGETGQNGKWGLNLPGIPVVNGEMKQGYAMFAGYIARFDPTDTGYDLQYSTHVGGTYMYGYYGDAVGSITVNPDGSFWIGGTVTGADAYPAAADQVADPSASTWSNNVFAMRFDAGAIPQAELFTTFGGDYYYENMITDIATDEDGDLYFVGSSAYDPWGWGGLPPLPTTANALQPSKLGNRDHFYGKFGSDGSIQHLSYWGTSGVDEGAPAMGGLLGPSLVVTGKDQIAIAGTVGTCCVPVLSTERIAPGGYGGADGYLSHIHFDEGVLFSTHIGGPGNDHVSALAYDPENKVFYVGGTTNKPIQPNILFPEVMPRPLHNGRYDAFVTAIDPARHNPAQAPDQQESKVAYTMYMGNQVGSDDAFSNRVHHLSTTDRAGLLVGGNQGGSSLLADASPTSWNAIDNGPTAQLENAAMFQRYHLKLGLDINASDGVRHAATPDDERFDTLTLRDVYLNATINNTILPGVTPSDLRWDLDGDRIFDDASGAGMHIMRRPHQELVEVCLEAPLDFPGAPPVEVCLDVFFENRPPVAIVELLGDPVGFLDPLPYFHTGRPVWFDGSGSFDPEGSLDYEAQVWEVETRNETTGAWEPDDSVRVGGEASFGLMATFAEPGQKRVTLTVQDTLGATKEAPLAVVLVSLPPAVECAIAGPVRQDRWIGLDVVATPGAFPLDGWVVDPGMGLPQVVGDGPPPGRIRTPALPATGGGTLRLTITDTSGATASCQQDYVAGSRQVTADYTLGTAVAGMPVHMVDRSFPESSQLPIIRWEWQVDGIALSTGPDATHVFGHAGTYLVSLTVHDGYRSDTYSMPIDVLPPRPGPEAQIGVEPPPYLAGRAIRFTDESLAGDAPIVERTWNFGGRPGTGAKPSVMLPAGEHVVRLTVHDLDGRVSQDEVTIQVVDPGGVVPEYTVSTTAPFVGQAVRFMDASTTGSIFIEAREWAFSDGSRFARGAVVDHTFWQPGTYDVTLTLYDNDARRYVVTHPVTVIAPTVGLEEGPGVRKASLPIADAGVDRRVQAGSVVLLDASSSVSQQSAGLTASWRQLSGPTVALVPEGTGASLRMPYAPGQVIAVELVVADDNGLSDPDVVRLHIVSEHADGLGDVPAPDADFALERTDRLVRFVAPSHPVAAEYAWDLGDGTTMTGREAVHEYVAHKTYHVTLTVRDVHGQETVHHEAVEIRSSGDVAGFASAPAQKTVLGFGLQNVLLGGLLAVAGATLATLLVRRAGQ